MVQICMVHGPMIGPWSWDHSTLVSLRGPGLGPGPAGDPPMEVAAAVPDAAAVPAEVRRGVLRLGVLLPPGAPGPRLCVCGLVVVLRPCRCGTALRRGIGAGL